MPGVPSSFRRNHALGCGRKRKGTRMLQPSHYTLALRVCFLLVLGAVAVICGSLSYTLTKTLEEEKGEQNYEKVAAATLEGAQALAERTHIGGQALASMLGAVFPNPDDWPFVHFHEYTKISNIVGELSASSFNTFNPIVYPSQVEEFNAFAFENKADIGVESVGYHSSGFGIWKFGDYNNTSENRGKLPADPASPSFEGSRYSFASPVFQNPLYPSFYLFDTHSSPHSGPAQEAILDCAKEAEPGDDCGVMTDIISVLDDLHGISAIFYDPVYPGNDSRRVVGFIATNFHFLYVLQNVVHDDVNGLDCILSTGTQKFSFTIANGVPNLVGVGDHHDKKFEKFGRSILLNNFGSEVSVRYTLTVYPTESILSDYRTETPRLVTIGIVGAICFCSVVFLFYDFLMRGESRERRVILETKRRFVRFVSHEIRTPLQTVSMGATLLRSELAAERKRSCKDECPKQNKQESRTISTWLDIVDDIAESTETAVTILNNVLNYDKVESGTFEVEAELVDILGLLQKLVGDFEIPARKKSIAITLENPTMDSPPSTKIGDEESSSDRTDWDCLIDTHAIVVGDSQRIRQIFRNIFSNALKFSPEDSSITVSTSFIRGGLQDSLIPAMKRNDEEVTIPRRHRYGSILFSIHDEGAGMTEEQLCDLFGEGIQFNANTLQDGGGSGLGLFISQELVNKHGGRISAQSDGLGRGSSFTVELPLFLYKTDESPLLHLSQSGKSSSSRCNSVEASQVGEREDENSMHVPRCHHILVVDDAQSTRKMLVKVLERQGHICKSAGDGKEAITVFEKSELEAEKHGFERIDTILMDFEMPILNGPDATKLLRKDGCNALIVGVTGNVLPEDVEYFKLNGADHVLGKPLKIDQLEELWRGKTDQQDLR